MARITLRRIGLALGAVALALGGAFAWVNHRSDGALWLRVKHRAVTWLAEGTAVVTFDRPPLGRFEMFLNPADRVITPLLQAQHVWEAAESELFVALIRPGDTVVDVGANVGYYTVLASRAVGPTGRVFAFEPDPTSFEILKRNVRLEGATNVVAEQMALSDTDGTLELFIAQTNKGDHRIYAVEGEDRPSVTVPARRLDTYLAGKGPVHLIKMDTQGAEGVIVKGMAATLAAHHPRLILEFWPAGLAKLGGSAEGLLADLGRQDYRFLEVPPGDRVGAPPRPRAPKGLLADYPPAGLRHTSVLAVTGAEVYLAAEAEARAALSAMETLSPALEATFEGWRAGVDAGTLQALPPAVAEALTAPAPTAMQARLARRAFAQQAPEMAAARARFEAAVARRAALDAAAARAPERSP